MQSAKNNKHGLGIIDRLRFLFLFVILLTFFITKAVSQTHQAETIANTIFLIIIVYSLYVIGHEKRFLIIVLGLTGLAELTVVLSSHFVNSNMLLVLNTLFGLLFFLTMTIACLNYTLHDKEITVTTLFGSLCAYLFIGLTWAYCYLFIDVIDPSAFALSDKVGSFNDKQEQFIYYSFVTLTTLGYGDMVPYSNLAKTLAWMEAYTGQAYLTVLMALLVGRYVANKER